MTPSTVWHSLDAGRGKRVNYFTQDTSNGNMIVKILSRAAEVYALQFNEASEPKGMV